jgi:TRAP-type uncharacterized transport system substrate-binding protein
MKSLHIAAFAAALAVPGIAYADENFPYCTGPSGGNYEFTGVAIKRQLPRVIPVTTKGSLDNMEQVDKGTCAAAIVQSDAYFVYMADHSNAALTVERARDMYPEYGHMICNATIAEISDLKRGNTVFVGPAGSGSAVMWDAITRANPKYKDVATLPIGGDRALGKVSDGQDGQCMLFVAGLRSQSMMNANNVAKTTNGNLRLVYMRDPKLFDLKDAKGRPIYKKATIPSGTYPGGLQESGIFTSGHSVDTIEVESVLVDSIPYADKYEGNLNIFLAAVNKAMPSINDHVLPK